jgi:polysaccharide deacetylase family protein (PEP-CTERM system associated)
MREVAPKCAWHTLPSGIERNMEKLLDLLRAHEAKATFFVLGWVADRFPEVVRMIDREGHEIGTHGYHHALITEMTPSEFEEDLLRSLEAIGRHTSQRIRGHRASNFSVVPSTLWALDILARHGMQYDSSIFPIARKRYGMPDWPNRHPHTLKLASGRSLTELPMSTVRMGGRRLPIAGGGYLRLYPSQMTERFIAAQNLRGLPAMVYLHPWELDPEQTRRDLGWMKGFQHYVNLDTTEWKLNRLLQRFDFGPVGETLGLPRLQSLLRRAPVTVPESMMDPAYSARPAYARPFADAPAGARPMIETPAGVRGADIAGVWPLHVRPSQGWSPVGNPLSQALEAADLPAAEKRREGILLEDLETTLADAG